jgi:hypothetical protein
MKSILKSRSSRKLGNWLLGIIAIIIILLWNWKLLLATVIGCGIMLLTYLLPSWNWRLYWSKLQINSFQRQLIVAVGSGGLAAFGTYLAASIWTEAKNPWLATGTIFQGLISLATFVILLWQIISLKLQRQEVLFEQYQKDLTEVNPLKRLIAIRKLTRLLTNHRLKAVEAYQLKESFELMLSLEPEKMIRNALLESLQLWEQTKASNPLKNPPLKIPLQMKKELKNPVRQ